VELPNRILADIPKRFLLMLRDRDAFPSLFLSRLRLLLRLLRRGRAEKRHRADGRQTGRRFHRASSPAPRDDAGSELLQSACQGSGRMHRDIDATATDVPKFASRHGAIAARNAV